MASVGDKAVNAEARATLCVMKNLRKGETKQDTHIEREREKERHKRINYIQEGNSYKRQQPLLKVTKSLYIVTNIGQLPFMLFTQMAQTWAVQRDSVNTTIIHSYSTRRTCDGST